MPTPIRLVGHSPYQPLRAIHPPRPREVQRATEGSALGVALLWCALCIGLIGGITLTAYWREIVTAALLFLFSAACAFGIRTIDRRQR